MVNEQRIKELRETREAIHERSLDLVAETFAIAAEIERLRGDRLSSEWNLAMARVYRERFSDESMAAKDAILARLGPKVATEGTQ